MTSSKTDGGNATIFDPTVPQTARTVNGDNMAETDDVQWAGNMPAEAETVDAMEQLRRDYAEGKITDEEFDEAMEIIRQEESAAGESMVEGVRWAGNETQENGSPRRSAPRDDSGVKTVAENNNTETEDMTYGEQQNQGESSSARWDDAGRTDGNSDRSEKRNAGAAVIRRSEEARRVQSNVKAQGGSRTSLRKLGLSVGSEEESVQLVTREAYTPALEEAQRLADAEGLRLVPVVGSLYVYDQRGVERRVAAVIENGTIYVQADSFMQDVVAEVKHEIYHHKANQDPKLTERIAQYIMGKYSEAEVQALYERYYDLYYKTFDARMTDEEIENAIWDEMLADAYGELQRYSDSYGTTEWTEAVRNMVERTETKNTAEGGEARMSAEVDPYSYEELVQKPPIDVTVISDREIPTRGKKVKSQEIANIGRNKAAILYNDVRGTQRYVYIEDLGGNVLVPKKGFEHGIQGNKTNSSTMRTAEVTYDLVDILRNSIVVNELEARQGDDCDYSYILFGYAMNEAGDEYIVKSTVNHYSDNKSVVDSVEIYDVLKGSKAKNVEAKVIGSHTGKPAARVLNALDSTTVSVAELLEAVKENYPELLPDGVREHFGIQNAPKEATARFSYGGKNARTADEASLQMAKDMLDMDVSMEEILRTTGWYQGRDGKWRFETERAETKNTADGGVARVSAAEDNSYTGRNMSEDSEIYSYDFLVSQPDMQTVILPEVDAVRDDNKRVDTAKVINAGIKNAVAVGEEQEGKVFVTNAYTGRRLRVTSNSIRHGLNGNTNRVLTNARLGAVVGNVLQNAIPINAMYNKADGVTGTYAMAAYATDSKNREFVAVITVEQRTGEVVSVEAYDMLHALSGRQKRNDSQADTKSQSIHSIKAADIISISDFLEIVNATHQSILSQDVLEHLGEKRDPDGYYADRVKFSMATEETDALPAKAQSYLRRVERDLVETIGTQMELSFMQRRGGLRAAVDRLAQEYLQNGDVSQQTVDELFDAASGGRYDSDADAREKLENAVHEALEDLRQHLETMDFEEETEYNYAIKKARDVARAFQIEFTGEVSFAKGIRVYPGEAATVRHALKTGYGKISLNGKSGTVNTSVFCYLFKVDNGKVIITKAVKHEDLNIRKNVAREMYRSEQLRKDNEETVSKIENSGNRRGDLGDNFASTNGTGGYGENASLDGEKSRSELDRDLRQSAGTARGPRDVERVTLRIRQIEHELKYNIALTQRQRNALARERKKLIEQRKELKKTMPRFSMETDIEQEELLTQEDVKLLYTELKTARSAAEKAVARCCLLRSDGGDSQKKRETAQPNLRSFPFLPSIVSFHDAAGADISGSVIFMIKAGDLDTAACCMDEQIVAHVDAHMRGSGRGRICIGEEHQIADLQIGDGVAVGQLLCCGTLEGVAHLLKDILGKAGAVKALGGRAAPDIGNSHIVLCQRYELLTGGLDHRGLAHRDLSVELGSFHQRDKIGADVAGDALILHLVPAAVEADDISCLTLREGSEELRVHIGSASEVHIAAFYDGIAQLHIPALVGGEIVLVHVSDDEIVIDQIPVTLLTDDDHAVTDTGACQDLSIGTGFGAQTKTARLDDTDTGLEFDGGDAHDHGRQNRDGDDRRQKSLEKFHDVPPCLPNGLLGSQRSFQPHTANIQCCVEAVFFTLLYDPVASADGGVGELQLYRDLGCELQLAVSQGRALGLKDLEHNDIFVGHGAVIDQVIFSHQGVTLVGEDLFSHRDLQ